MPTIKINGQTLNVTEANKKVAHLLQLGSRSQVVESTFYNSGLSPFAIKINPDTMVGECQELSDIADFMCDEKRADKVVFVADDGKDSRDREFTFGTMGKKVRAALASYGYFKAMMAVTEPVKGGIKMLKESGTNTGTTTAQPITAASLESLDL